jgi:hypothetical protein
VNTAGHSAVHRENRKKHFLETIGAIMLKQTFVRLTIVMAVLALAGVAQGQDRLQNFFSDAACKVKVTIDPTQKRELLNKSFTDMIQALNKVQGSPLVSKDDKAGIDRFTVILKEKQDELAGVNGFERVSDAQLNDFSDYVVQDMEQANETITISTVTLLLIVIIALII